MYRNILIVMLMLAIPIVLLVVVILALGWIRRTALARLRDDTRRCRRCGYDLRGLEIPRCPECGCVIGFTTTFADMGISEDAVRDHVRCKQAGKDASRK